MDEEKYEERVLSILRGGKGWDNLYSSISEFKHHLNEAGLAEEKLFGGWVLWHHSNHTSLLQHKIITLLNHIASTWCGLHYLVQFWAAVKVEGQHHYLTTSNQPFFVGKLSKGLCWYRKQCVDVEGAEAEQLGSVGRVYRNRHPESTPDLRLYSTHEFPLRDHAARCGFRGYLALPLFDFHNQNECCGVLELLSEISIMRSFNYILSKWDEGLQIAGLRSTHIPIRRYRNKLQPESEIREILELGIKAVPRLSLAQVWVPCKQCDNLRCMETASFINSQDRILNEWKETDRDMVEYLKACEFHNLQIDVSSLGRDLCDVSISKNPLAHYAERARLSLRFAICLQSVNNNSNHFYVIEFFLQPEYGEDARGDSSLHLLFKIMEMKLKSFKFVLGGKLVEEFVVESRQPPNAIEFESIDMLKSMDFYMEIISESNFTEYLEIIDLCCLRPSSEDSDEGWVFQRPIEEEFYERTPIKEKIQRFMKEIAARLRTRYCMVQFWAPRMVDDRHCLQTWDQPYALSCLAKGLASFRKECIKHHYFVDEEANEEELGPPGRVFKNGHPEIIHDPFFYSIKEFPMRSYAVHCGVETYFALPVFDEHEHFNKHDCVGVLEYIGFTSYYDFPLLDIRRALKAAKLLSTHIHSHPTLMEPNIHDCKTEAMTEIKNALNLFSRIPQCHTANVWIPNGKCMSSNSRCMKLVESLEEEDSLMVDWIHVEPKIGIIGMVLESESKSCFCQKICEFSIAEQSRAYCGRKLRRHACFAICLQSSHTGDLLYVLEFFLYRAHATYEYLRSFLNFLLPMIKHELKSFKIASGKQLGEEELVVEVIEFSEANQLTSSESDQLDVYPIKFKSVQYGQKEHQYIEEQQVQSNPEVRQRKQRNAAASNFKKTEKGKRKIGLHLSLEVLKPLFGMKLNDAAKTLGVGRSTIKRVCRENGIMWWPGNKKQARNPSLFQRESTQDHQHDMRPSNISSLQDEYIQQKEGGLFTSKGNIEDLHIQALETPEDNMQLHQFKGDEYDDDNDDAVQIIDGINTSQGPPKKKVEKAVVKERMVRSYALLPGPLKMLCSYAENDLNDGRGILIALDDDVFGDKCKIYVHLEDIIPFCDLEPISGNCIVVYIWHLYNKIKKENSLERFQFVNPFTISYVPNSKSTKRAYALADRLIVASPDELVLVPCNVGEHWILTIIEPYKNVVSLLDPISHCIRDECWKDVVNMAMTIFNANLKKYGKEQPTWEVIKVPRQPDSKQCGYYVMRYMKEIVQGLSTIDSSSLSSLFVREEYSQTDIDEVRIEWTHCVQDHV